MMMINLYKLFIFNSATAQWPNCAAYSLHPIALLIIKVKAVNGDHGLMTMMMMMMMTRTMIINMFWVSKKCISFKIEFGVDSDDGE